MNRAGGNKREEEARALLITAERQGQKRKSDGVAFVFEERKTKKRKRKRTKFEPTRRQKKGIPDVPSLQPRGEKKKKEQLRPTSAAEENRKKVDAEERKTMGEWKPKFPLSFLLKGERSTWLFAARQLAGAVFRRSGGGTGGTSHIIRPEKRPAAERERAFSFNYDGRNEGKAGYEFRACRQEELDIEKRGARRTPSSLRCERKRMLPPTAV